MEKAPIGGQGNFERGNDSWVQECGYDILIIKVECCVFGLPSHNFLTQESISMSSVVKKRRKKMRKHKHKKLRRRMKFAKRRN
jgi:hypothetical protein